MSETTKIEWADSTLNLMMGCDGCELWTKDPAGVRTCYAGVMTAQYAGQPGWPSSFDRPRLFPMRVADAKRWPDLTGWAREHKPWLGRPPRLVFLDDMGDTFTESFAATWILEHLPALEATPHRYLLLTKRPHRAATAFREYGRVPRNLWLGVTVTNRASLGRVDKLLAIGDEHTLRWVSCEPQLEELPTLERAGIDWIVYGGESGRAARSFHVGWLPPALERCEKYGIAPFLKQVGSAPTWPGPWSRRLLDAKGGDWHEWPDALRVREMPSSAKVYPPSLRKGLFP